MSAYLSSRPRGSSWVLLAAVLLAVLAPGTGAMALPQAGEVPRLVISSWIGVSYSPNSSNPGSWSLSNVPSHAGSCYAAPTPIVDRPLPSCELSVSAGQRVPDSQGQVIVPGGAAPQCSNAGRQGTGGSGELVLWTQPASPNSVFTLSHVRWRATAVYPSWRELTSIVNGSGWQEELWELTGQWARNGDTGRFESLLPMRVYQGHVQSYGFCYAEPLTGYAAFTFWDAPL